MDRELPPFLGRSPGVSLGRGHVPTPPRSIVRNQRRTMNMFSSKSDLDEIQSKQANPRYVVIRGLMIKKIMKALNIESSDNVVKVGDTEVDINEGINAGCKYVVGITTGAFTRDELLPYKPTHIIDNISEVLNIVSLNSAYKA